MRGAVKILLVAAGVLSVAGCDTLRQEIARPDTGALPPVLNPVSEINAKLRALPPPVRRTAIAVYGYTDQTGQFKPAENIQALSRAVTQGATSVLIKALQDTGGGSWFMVVEREKLDNLMRERKLIAEMRATYLGERSVNPKALPALLFAGVLLEGGIIGYDSNVRTGGAGARYLGIGGSGEYREDTVTVYLRAISTKTGEVLTSVVAHKTIISVGLHGDAFKYVALDRILEAEAGITHNEPKQLAVQQAIEKAVYALIIEGCIRGIWGFADKGFQAQAIEKHQIEQSGFLARLEDEVHRRTAPLAELRAPPPGPVKVGVGEPAPGAGRVAAAAPAGDSEAAPLPGRSEGSRPAALPPPPGEATRLALDFGSWEAKVRAGEDNAAGPGSAPSAQGTPR